MNLKELKNLDKDDILEMLGVETKRSTGEWLTGVLGTFGVGLLVGAGIGLMLAPKPGRELRSDLRERLRRAPEDIKDAVASVTNREAGGGHESLAGANKSY